MFTLMNGLSFECIFWTSLGVLTYTFLGYPCLMLLLGKAFPKPITSVPSNVPPDVSVVLIAHNEVDRLEARIRNLLDTGYPPNLLEVIIVSDASTDGTSELFEKLAGVEPRITLVTLAKRSGKPAGLNHGVRQARSEIVVFADARQRFESETIPNLVRPFSDGKVGAVSGKLAIEPSESGTGAGTDLYWKLETQLRRSEAAYDSVIGCTGAVYAIRRSLFKELPADTLLDDVVIPMRAAMQGFRVVFEENALAWDPQPLSRERERLRKKRTLAGNFQMLMRYPGWLLPVKNRLWWQLISHKYLRLTAPVFLGLSLLSCLPLLHLALYQGLFFAQCAFYLAAGLGMVWSPSRPAVVRRLFSIPAAFLFLNWMVIRGLGAYLRNEFSRGWR